MEVRSENTPENSLGYLLVRAASRVARPWESKLSAHGINPRQFSVLAWLARDPGLSSAELARRVMVTPQSMSESLRALIGAGLVARSAAEPGRASQLRISESGHSLLARAYPLVDEANAEAFGHLTATERRTLSALLAKVIDP